MSCLADFIRHSGLGFTMHPSQTGLVTGRFPWATWLVVAFGATLLCICVVDRPLAEFAATHRVHVRGIQFLIGMPGLLLGAALVVPVLRRTLRTSQDGWWKIVTPCSNAIVWTAAAVELALKPVLGRSGPFSWLEHNEFAFHWLAGRSVGLGSMPSGEAAILAAALGVLWVMLPGLRWAYLLIGGLEAVSLVWFNWHFASDVIAGAAIGAVGAILALSRG